MKKFHRITQLAVIALMISGFCGSKMFAQASDDGHGKQHMKNQTTMTGCLTKDTAGNYVLTDEKTGAKTVVTGTAALEKHSANHKVTLTGMSKTDSTGKEVFEVSKIQHVSASCSAPSQ